MEQHRGKASKYIYKYCSLSHNVTRCYMSLLLLFVYMTLLVNIRAYLYDCVGPIRSNQAAFVYIIIFTVLHYIYVYR